MDKQFDTPDPVELVVELGSGGIRVEAIDVDQSTVTVTGPRAEEFRVECIGRRLSVLAPRHHGMFGSHDSHDVRVVVPTGSDLDTRTGSADTAATGSYRVVRTKSGSGDLEIDRTTSHLVSMSGSGEVTCDVVGGDLRVKSGSGDIEIGEARGAAAVSTGSGDVALGRSLATTVIKTGSGSGLVQRCCGDLTFKAGSGELTVAHAEKGVVRAATSSGDLRVGVPAGTPVWTDLSSNSGRIRNELAPVGKPAEGADHVELRLHTSSGDITLHEA